MTAIPENQEENAETDLIFLDAATLRLFRTGGSTVRMTIEGASTGRDRTYIRVQIARAFPFSRPDTYIGFRDGVDKDIGLLVTLDGLDPDSRRILDEELDRRYFLPKIQRVRSVKEEFNLSTWEVETDRGLQTFFVQNIRESVQSLSPTRVLLLDKDGHRYEVPDTTSLDPKSRALLQRGSAS